MTEFEKVGLRLLKEVNHSLGITTDVIIHPDNWGAVLSSQFSWDTNSFTSLYLNFFSSSRSASTMICANSFHVVFYAAAPITAIGFFLALMLRETPLRTNADYQKAKDDAAGEALG